MKIAHRLKNLLRTTVSSDSFFVCRDGCIDTICRLCRNEKMSERYRPPSKRSSFFAGGDCEWLKKHVFLGLVHQKFFSTGKNSNCYAEKCTTFSEFTEGAHKMFVSSGSGVKQGWLSCTPICRARRMRGGRRTRHREPNPGDWLCQCGETNYRSKRECFKCGAPAPPLPPGVRRPSLPGEDPHDWACACGQMNFRGSVVCHKCAQPKPVPPGQETPLWTCPGCKGINREHRKTCFKCGAVSPNIVFPGSAGSLKLGSASGLPTAK